MQQNNAVPKELKGYCLRQQHLGAFQFCSTLELTLEDFCIDSWKHDFTLFLKEMLHKYDKHIFCKGSINYTDVSKQGGMYGAFHEVSIIMPLLRPHIIHVPVQINAHYYLGLDVHCNCYSISTQKAVVE